VSTAEARDLVRDAGRRDVSRHSEGALADFLRQRLGALPVADVHRDQGAALVQARRGSPSEAAPGAGDYSDASRKISVFHLGSQDPIVADARDANAQNSNLFSDGGISAAYRERKWIAISASCVLALAVTRKVVTSKFTNWALCLCHIGVLGMEIQLRRQ